MGAVHSCVGGRHPDRSRHSRNTSRASMKTPYDKKSRKKGNISATFNLIGTDVNIEQLNINQASEEELMTLKGIDRTTAHNIVEHRRQIGAFKRVEDLALVSGVGATKLTQIRLEICVSRKKASENSSIDGSNELDNVSKCSMKSRISLMPIKVNVNKGNVFQLMKVKGVSQQLAQNIVAYRDKKGLYRTLDELGKVKGVSSSVLSAIRPLLVLQDDDLVTTTSMHQINGVHKLNPSQLFSHSRSMSYTNGYTNATDLPPNNHTCAHITTTHHAPPTHHTAGLHHTNHHHSLDDMLHASGPMGKKSYRPKCEPVLFHRNSRPIVRMASWNLQKCGCEKAENPGVKEVVAMTMLENGISLLAVQELTDAESLQKICDELNRPTIPTIKNFDGHSGYWKCLVSGPIDTAPNKGSEHLGFLYDSSRGIEMKQCHLVEFSVPTEESTPISELSTHDIRPHTPTSLTNSGSDLSAHTPNVELNETNVIAREKDTDEHICEGKSGAFFVEFRMDGWQFCAVNVSLSGCMTCTPRVVSSGCDSGVLSVDSCQRHCDTIQADMEKHANGLASIMLGSIGVRKNSKCGMNSCTGYGSTHTVESQKQSCQDKVWLHSSSKTFHTGEHGSVTQGLSSQWIPKGFWSWGGAVSEHPPVWCELYADGGKVSSDLQQLLKSLGHSMNLNSDPEFTL